MAQSLTASVWTLPTPFSSFLAYGKGSSAEVYEDQYLLSHLSWGVRITDVLLKNLPPNLNVAAVLRSRNLKRLKVGKGRTEDVYTPLALLRIISDSDGCCHWQIKTQELHRITAPEEALHFELVGVNGVELSSLRTADSVVRGSLYRA